MFRTVWTLLIIPFTAFATTYSLMNFTPSGEAELERFLGSGVEIIHVYDDGSIDFVANETERTGLMNRGIFCTTRIADLQRFYEARCGGKSMGGFMR